MENTFKSTAKARNLKEILRSSTFWKIFTGIVLGIAGGFMFYYFIGCPTGTCPISSNPYLSMIWGGLMGLFISRILTLK